MGQMYYDLINMSTPNFKDLLILFHGPNFTEEKWNCRDYDCCALCKTKQNEGKSRHWANGLCRSCYRRLSPAHRLYNDLWAEREAKIKPLKKTPIKKEYKTLELDSILFDTVDIETLLERYYFKCAYCACSLQDYDHTKNNAFQVEYKKIDTGIMLIPVCRSCNCSKKNLTEDLKLRRWAREHNIKYPFQYIYPKPK